MTAQGLRLARATIAFVPAGQVGCSAQLKSTVARRPVWKADTAAHATTGCSQGVI